MDERREALLLAAKEVGPGLFFSLLIITVSFLPVFALEAQEGRLFKPLAYTKTYAMIAGALLSVTVVCQKPALLLTSRSNLSVKLQDRQGGILILASGRDQSSLQRRPSLAILHIHGGGMNGQKLFDNIKLEGEVSERQMQRKHSLIILTHGRLGK